MSPADDWDQIIRLIRRYALRKYGDWAAGITIYLPCSRQSHYEPFPSNDAADTRSPPRTVTAWGAGPVPKHTDNFSALYWPNLGTYYFQGDKQQAVIACLWNAQQDGLLEVSQAVLLRAADSDGTRLHDLFRNHPAWGKLIRHGRSPGSYTLPPVPSTEPSSEEDSSDMDQ